jgi:beta-lactamase regulating signal transducer with metallopeptidase domain
MILSRALLLATALVASYVASSAVVSAIVALLWKAGWLHWTDIPARARAGRLATLRLLPPSVLAIVTIFFIFPLFLALEPVSDSEAVGPALLLVSLIGLGLAVRSFITALRIVLNTRRIRRAWLPDAEPLQISNVKGIAAYRIESAQPIVALVGISRPSFVAAGIVVDACTENELANMVRHERTHLLAHDNLKRLLLACVPDVLSLTPYHRAIANAWHEAAEDAADDAATLGEPHARMELAALLLKVAGLAPSPTYASVTISPFIAAHGLERRVRRLVSDQLPTRARPSDHFAGAVLIGIALLASMMLFSSTARSIVHTAIETVVAAGARGR